MLRFHNFGPELGGLQNKKESPKFFYLKAASMSRWTIGVYLRFYLKNQ